MRIFKDILAVVPVNEAVPKSWEIEEKSYKRCNSSDKFPARPAHGIAVPQKFFGTTTGNKTVLMPVCLLLGEFSTFEVSSFPIR